MGEARQRPEERDGTSQPVPPTGNEVGTDDGIKMLNSHAHGQFTTVIYTIFPEAMLGSHPMNKYKEEKKRVVRILPFVKPKDPEQSTRNREWRKET